MIDKEAKKWIELHGEPTTKGTRFLCQCSKLKDGKCSIYADRPRVCKEYAVGSRGCLEAVRRFNPDKQNEIRRLIQYGEAQSG